MAELEKLCKEKIVDLKKKSISKMELQNQHSNTKIVVI